MSFDDLLNQARAAHKAVEAERDAAVARVGELERKLADVQRPDLPRRRELRLTQTLKPEHGAALDWTDTDIIWVGETTGSGTVVLDLTNGGIRINASGATLRSDSGEPTAVLLGSDTTVHGLTLGGGLWTGFSGTSISNVSLIDVGSSETSRKYFGWFDAVDGLVIEPTTIAGTHEEAAIRVTGDDAKGPSRNVRVTGGTINNANSKPGIVLQVVETAVVDGVAVDMIGTGPLPSGREREGQRESWARGITIRDCRLTEIYAGLGTDGIVIDNCRPRDKRFVAKFAGGVDFAGRQFGPITITDSHLAGRDKGEGATIIVGGDVPSFLLENNRVETLGKDNSDRPVEGPLMFKGGWKARYRSVNNVIEPGNPNWISRGEPVVARLDRRDDKREYWVTPDQWLALPGVEGDRFE